MSIKVLYRLSDKGREKKKISNSSKSNCLQNAIDVFGLKNITLFADNCEEETLDMIRKSGLLLISTSLGNSASWRYVVEYAVKNFEDAQTVYLLEDDYFHLSDAPKCIEEGVEIADYVTLYDHPDKYVNAKDGGNPLVKRGGEKTRVLLSETTHWKETGSTTMTFACKVKVLRDDLGIWKRYTSTKTPKDFRAFRRLTGKGNVFYRIFGRRRRLISSIPARSTHTEVEFLSALINWSRF